MKTPKPKIQGEPLVWLTSMGLSTGMAMVLALLGLILYHGLQVFWPKSVVAIEWKNPQEPSAATEKILGEIVLKQDKPLSVTADLKNPKAPQTETEWQIYQGNKEVFGQSFRFIDATGVKSLNHPPEAMVLERLEYGNALGFPVGLKLSGQNIPATAPSFLRELQAQVRSVVRRWDQIEKIEKGKIGSINKKLEILERERRQLEKAAPSDLAVQLLDLDARRQTLQESYDQLAAQAKKLREDQKGNILTYRLANGEEKEIELGQVLGFYFPNQMGFTQKIGFFFHKGWDFLSQDPREANTEGGVFPALFGTFVMTVLMSLAVVPFGVLAAIYLREYVKQGTWVRLIRIAVNNLAGVPSIVFGIFGLGFFVYMLGGQIDHWFFADRLPTPTFGTGGILWASLTLALMTVPVVIVATEEALASVPRGTREGSLALGASKWQTIFRVLLPAAAPGILTGTILAMARGAGEVAPLMLVGVVKMAPTLPINGTFPYIHLDQKFMHLGFHIYDLGFQSPDSEAAKPMVFATTLLLIAVVLLLNLGAIVLRERLRKKYATGVF